VVKNKIKIQIRQIANMLIYTPYAMIRKKMKAQGKKERKKERKKGRKERKNKKKT